MSGATPVPPRTVELLTYQSLAADPIDVLDVLRELTARPAWMSDALCREYPHLSWFPERGESTTEQKAICRRCAVSVECFDYVNNDKIPDRHGIGQAWATVGIWGGTSGRERRRGRESAA